MSYSAGKVPRVSTSQRYRLRTPSTGREIFLAANERHEPFSMEHRLRTAGGEYRWVIDAGRPRFGPGGEFLG